MIFTGSDASDRYIGVTVKGLSGGDVEIQPRMRLLSGPYSLLSHNANNAFQLNGYDWSTIFPDTGNPSTGTFPGTKIAANSITGAQIANGGVGTSQLAAGAVATGNIAAGAVTGTQIANAAVGPAQIALPLYLSGYANQILFNFGGIATILSITNTATPGNSGFFHHVRRCGYRSGRHNGD